MSSRVEEKAGHLIKARSLLEKARQCNPGTPELWLEAVRVENHAGLHNVAQSLMAKGVLIQSHSVTANQYTTTDIIEYEKYRKTEKITHQVHKLRP